MVIKKKISDFIDKGADVKGNTDKSFKNILIRMPTSLLQELDLYIEKKPWVSRTQWILDAVHENLKKGP